VADRAAGVSVEVERLRESPRVSFDEGDRSDVHAEAENREVEQTADHVGAASVGERAVLELLV